YRGLELFLVDSVDYPFLRLAKFTSSASTHPMSSSYYSAHTYENVQASDIVILRHLIEFVPYATFYRLTSKPPKRSPQKTSSAQMPAPADAPKSAGGINEPKFSDFYEKLLVSEGASPETTAYDLDHYSASSQRKFSIQ